MASKEQNVSAAGPAEARGADRSRPGTAEAIEVVFRKSRPLDDPIGRYPGFAPAITVDNGICIERDVAVKMRDGISIYADIYRPEGATNVPAIVAWSPYGKRGGLSRLDDIPGRAGVPLGTPSAMAKWEAPDPAYWCKRGYAVVNPDSRGAFKSEGNILFFGSEEGRDYHDLIEFIAAQSWCNGKVALSGNSWLAIVQWYAAAERPPHLAAIAPWEGLDDFYRDTICPGGVPEIGFVGSMVSRLCGSGGIEDIPAMIEKYPLINEYWERKAARVEKIEIPAYVVASWTNPIHTHGTLDGFRRISSRQKWLRVHNTQEWPDYYDTNHVRHLERFFDRYLKAIDNGWETTPRVHLSILDPGGLDQINRVEHEWPLARTQFEKLFLDAASGTLAPKPAERESEIRYAADETGQAVFVIRFSEDTELTGYMKLRLWVEAKGADDMDLFVVVQKLDSKGQFVPALVVGKPSPGAPGWLRVSHRELDLERSTPSEPYLTHKRELLLKPKEIVPVEIGIWPTGMLWHTSEQLRLIIAGHPLTIGAGEPSPFRYVLRNRGQHVIYTGGKFDSHLLVPKIPR